MPNNESKLLVGNSLKYISKLDNEGITESKISVENLSKKVAKLSNESLNDSTLQVLNNLLTSRGKSYQSRLDTVSPADTSTPQYGGLDVLFGNSGFQVTGNSTIYLAQGSDSTEAEVRIPMPACTMKEMRVASSIAPGTSQTFTYTLMKNGVAINELQAEISGSGTSSTISPGTGIGFNAGDTFSVRLVTSLNALVAYHSYSIKVV